MVSKNYTAVIDLLAAINASIPQIQELEFTTKLPVETEEEFDLLEDELKQSYEKRKFLVKTFVKILGWMSVLMDVPL